MALTNVSQVYLLSEEYSIPVNVHTKNNNLVQRTLALYVKASSNDEIPSVMIPIPGGGVGGWGGGDINYTYPTPCGAYVFFVNLLLSFHYKIFHS